MDSRSSIRPARALLSPTWLLALAVLLVNDRWLKYADLAPGWLTGKLSDLAGMLVAPVLLAVLLGVRRRGALLACHVAVGLVFAAIKLSPACAATWSWAMGLLGYPWTIVCDGTDLLALPLLFASWQLLLPHMDPEASPLVPLQRSAVAALAVLGLWSSVATTEGPDDEPFYDEVYGQLYINNASDVPIAFHVRLLRTDVQIDCDEVDLDPGRLLSLEAFGGAQHWLLDPGVNLGLEVFGNGCGAALVAGEGIEPTIFFIQFSTYPPSWWPGFTQNSDDLMEQGQALKFDGEGLATWIGLDDVRFTPRTDTPEQAQECEPPPSESGLDWSVQIPEHAAEIVALDAGVDGCFEFTLQDHIVEGDAVVPFETPYAWYLCAPAAAVPFVVGEFIGFEVINGPTSSRELSIMLLNSVDLLPATSNGVLLRRVHLLNGGAGPEYISSVLEREVEPVPATSCPWLLEPGCATAERSAQLRLVGSANPYPVGTPVMLSDPPLVRTMVLTHMRQRAVIDQACSGGGLLSYDIDLALVEEPG